MLTMIREFALAQMGSAERSLAQQRHTAYFVAQADQQLALMLAAIAQDHDNFRSALTTAIAAQDADAAFTRCINLVCFWEMHGYLREGVSHVRAVLALPAATPLRFELLERMTTLAFQVHQFDVATEFVEQLLSWRARMANPWDWPAPSICTDVS